MKIASVVGARPQFIKFAALDPVLSENHQHIMIHTGQHYDYEMSLIFFEELDLRPPDYNLEVGSGTHGWQTAEMLKRLEAVLTEEQPDIVLVYGDTNSTLAGGLGAAKMRVPLAHVEAGLRSFNRDMPEEINRIVVDHVSDFLFCPTEASVVNLQREGITTGVHLVGDVMLDMVLHFRDIAMKRETPSRFGLRAGEYLLLTIHRPANTDNLSRLEQILRTLDSLEEIVLFPAHPRAAKQLEKSKIRESLSSRIHLSRPLAYLDFLSLLMNAKKVLTDSGGVQKEAYFLGVPCITLREETEWKETVHDGWNVLVGANPTAIKRAVLGSRPTSSRPQHFGRGRAAQEIGRILDRSEGEPMPR